MIVDVFCRATSVEAASRQSFGRMVLLEFRFRRQYPEPLGSIIRPAIVFSQIDAARLCASVT